MTEDPEVPSQNATGSVLTIVMHCLNEAETLAICVQSSLRALGENSIPCEVIVADNGSTDGSQAIAVENGARVLPVPIRGYGAALMAGIKAANTPYVLMIDADDSYNFSHAPRFLAELQKGAAWLWETGFAVASSPEPSLSSISILGIRC